MMFRSIRAGLTRPSYLRSTLRHRGFVTTTPPTDNKHAVPQRGMSKKGGRDRRGNRITSTDDGEEEEEETGKDASPGASEGVGAGDGSSSQETEVSGGGGGAEDQLDHEDGEDETIPFPDEYERLTTQDSRKAIRSPKRIRKRKPARSSSFNQTDFDDSELMDPTERRLNQKKNPEGILTLDGGDEGMEREETEEGEVVPAAAAADTPTPTPTPHTAHLTEYPPMPHHPKERMLGLPEDDYDLDNPWGDLDALQSEDNQARNKNTWVHEKTELDALQADVLELKDMRKYSLEEEDELVEHYRKMQEDSSNNAYNVPM